jgi:glyoxylase-like metal-dependent hydrolase (beta-lactamase superfamily II)
LADRLQWIEAGTYLVAPGVHRIPLPLPMDGLRAVNVYAIEAAGGLVLIDSGWALAESRDLLERSLATIGAGLPDVRMFLVTHLHRDHFTQAVVISRELGTAVALGEEERHSISRLLSSTHRPLNAQLGQLALAGAEPVVAELTEMIAREHGDMRPAEFGFGEPTEWITAGHVFDLGDRQLEAIATPGHTRGHLVFADRASGLLFAGDHVLPHITPSIGFEEAPPELPLRHYLESLNVVRRMPDMTLLPAHGPVAPSAHARIDELIAHHQDRLTAMAGVLAGGELTAYEVAAALPWTSRKRLLSDMDPMNKMLAICETAYHLDLLVAQDAAVSRVTDGAKRYQLVPPPVGP